MATNLVTLRTAARQMADLENSAFVSDAEFNTYINFGYRKLYSILLTLHEDYFLKSQTIPIVMNQEDYELSTDFFKLKGVDLLPGGDTTFPITLYPFQWEERNRFRYYQVLIQPLYASIYRYKLMGLDSNGRNYLKIIPVTTNASDQLRVWYIPDVTQLTSDSDAVMTDQLFDEYIAKYAAMQAMNKEETISDAQKLEFAALEEWVIKTASTRRVDAPRRIATNNNDYEGLATGFVGGYGIGMGGSEIF